MQLICYFSQGGGTLAFQMLARHIKLHQGPNGRPLAHKAQYIFLVEWMSLYFGLQKRMLPVSSLCSASERLPPCKAIYPDHADDGRLSSFVGLPWHCLLDVASIFCDALRNGCISCENKMSACPSNAPKTHQAAAKVRTLPPISRTGGCVQTKTCVSSLLS